MTSSTSLHWPTILRRACLAAVAITALTGRPAPAADALPLPMLSNRGTDLVDPAGRRVVLKGCNLGNHLLLESWMFGGTLHVNGKPFHDQAALFRAMDERFGKDKSRQLMDVFRESYVTPRDFDLIKSFGFNVVRLPFDYRLMQDDSAPDALRPDAFRWLDHVLAMAEQAGVYVILDLHGTPGGQSKQDHTGESGQNQLWNNPANQTRTVALWKAIAERYKDRAIVAAYDLINEPYGDYQQDVRPELATLLPRIAEAVRSTGDRHVLYYPGALNGGINFYGKPDESKTPGIAFTEHYYPGLFGSKTALETHARLLGTELPAKRAYLQRVAAPYLVGEFNVVLASTEPNKLMRRYFDRYAEYGWASTMWSYKLLKTDAGAAPSAWYMVTNAAALPTLDVATDSYEAIEAMFKGLATGPIAVNEALRTELTKPTPSPLPLAKYTPMPTAAPAGPPSNPPGHTSADIGDSRPGHTKALPGDRVEVVGGGVDINATHDAFRYVAKPVSGPAGLSATLTGFTDTDQYAKAGVMARWGDAPGAAMAMVNVFPDGTIALISRPASGGTTTEEKIAAGVSLPVQLRLDVDNGRATASYRTDRGAWQTAGTASVPTDADYRLGLAACAHNDSVLTTVKATLGTAGDVALPAAGQLGKRPAGPSLLANGSFEEQGEAADRAAGWNRWGDWMNRETAWTPTHDGRALIGYHHWRLTGGGASGLWQDVKAKAGDRYAFTVLAQHDPATGGAQNAGTLELRLESVTPDGQITLNSQDFAVNKLATGQGWSRLSVSGTATSDTLRVLAVINAAADAPRGGAVKLDDATVTPATDGR